MLSTESDNYVIFEDLEGNKTLYERIFNSIHDFIGSEGLVSTLDETQVDFNYETIDERKLDGLNLGSLVLNVTEQCNLRCGYCIYSGNYEGQRVHGTKSMTLDTARKAINIFMDKSAVSPHILFYGGEPLVASDLVHLVVNYVNENHHGRETRFGMTTNFTLGHKDLDFLVNNDFVLSVSLDGDEIVHDASRKFANGKGTYSKIVRNLLELKEKAPDYFKRKVIFSVTIADPSSLRATMDYFSEGPFSENPLAIQAVEQRFRRNLSSTSSVVQADLLSELKENYFQCILHDKEVSPFLRALFDKAVLPIYSRDQGRIPSTLPLRGMCLPGYRKLFADTDGTFFMCEKMGGREELGNINEGLDPTKVVSAFNAYSKVKSSSCKSCWAARICDSCASSSLDLRGLSVEGQKLTCGTYKNKLLNGLAIMSSFLRRDSLGNFDKYYSELIAKEEK